MDFNSNCTPSCAPPQVITFTYAFNFEELSTIKIYNDCNCLYNEQSIEWAYSIDNICWSCYMSYNDMLENTIGIKQDFFIRLKISGVINNITINGESFTDYTTSLFQCFSFTGDPSQYSNNLYNPYANMDYAIGLQQQLTESVSNMFGIPIYYFKLSPNSNSKDITFKEYALMDVESVKQIKLIITDGTMPSSKPEFNEWGLDWQTDWQTEISKAMFATAFGANAQPMEGDLIYIPMMKRMWMVNGAYEEKNEGIMWTATTFKLMLVKYQEKGSVDLGDTEALVNSFVKNKYEDLFGDQEPLDSSVEVATDSTVIETGLYPIFKSDATRKYITCDPISFNEESLYYKGTLISDLQYKFDTSQSSSIIYQRQYCGDSGSISFILTPNISYYNGILLEIGNIKVKISQNNLTTNILLINNNSSIDINSNTAYFIYIRWSKQLNIIEMSAAKYMHNEKIPIYKLQSAHYYFDIENCIKSVSKWNIEMIQEKKSNIILHGLDGYITNIKIFDIYNDNVSELLQMYPNNQHLLVNDTARKIFDLNGVGI